MYSKHQLTEKNEEQKNSFSKNWITVITIQVKRNKLAELLEQYQHGSAKFYLTGERSVYPVTNFMELRDIDLIRSCT